MKGLRQFLDRYEPLLTVSPTAPHVRDASDLKRVMTFVVIGVFPCTLMALYNTGLQANTAMAGLGIDSVPGWCVDETDCLVHRKFSGSPYGQNK